MNQKDKEPPSSPRSGFSLQPKSGARLGQSLELYRPPSDCDLQILQGQVELSMQSKIEAQRRSMMPGEEDASVAKKQTSKLAWALYVIMPPIIVFILLEVACVVLWRLQEQNLIYNSQTNAMSYGKTSANEVQLRMNSHLAALLATANFVTLTPIYSITEQYWENYTSFLYAQNPYYQLDIEPNGTISLMSTPWLNSSLNGSLTAQQVLAWQRENFDLGRNRLDPNNRPSHWPSWQFDVNTISIGRGGNVSIVGPWSSGPGNESNAVISVRMSLFLNPIQPDIPPSPNTSCPSSVCTTSDGRIFWGFISSSSLWSTILGGLSAVRSGGLHYSLSYPLNTYGPPLLDSNGQVGSDALCNEIFILNSILWQLCYVQPGGWKPSWTWILYLVFTVVCLAVSALLFFVLKGRQEARESLAHQRELNVLLEEERRKQIEWNRRLHEKKLKLETLMIRQYDLLEHFSDQEKRETRKYGEVINAERSVISSVQENSPSASQSGRFEDKIKAMRDQLASSGAAMMAQQDKIILYELLGQGTFGAVYLGEWRGTECAIKQMILPAGMDSSSRAEKMAIMEVAISSSLSHPHLVQTYTYKVKAVDEEGMIPMSVANSTSKRVQDNALAAKVSRPNSGVTVNSTPTCTAYHIQMVLEYCDGGSLRTLLNGTLQSGCRLGLSIVLDFASDVVRGMLYLHNQNILHLDLKAANVMLKSGRADNGTASEGWIAKVADFGLSVSLGDTAQAELQSQVGRGTRSHMAPELLLEGRYSKATDIYAFGITLWEMYTCNIPYDGIPAVALGKMVVYDGLRLDFPPDTPARLRRLVEACWSANPNTRPSFEYILKELTFLSDRTLGSKSNVRLRSRELSSALSGKLPEDVMAGILPPVIESPRTTPTEPLGI